MFYKQIFQAACAATFVLLVLFMPQNARAQTLLTILDDFRTPQQRLHDLKRNLDLRCKWIEEQQSKIIEYDKVYSLMEVNVDITLNQYSAARRKEGLEARFEADEIYDRFRRWHDRSRNAKVNIDVAKQLIERYQKEKKKLQSQVNFLQEIVDRPEDPPTPPGDDAGSGNTIKTGLKKTKKELKKLEKNEGGLTVKVKKAGRDLQDVSEEATAVREEMLAFIRAINNGTAVAGGPNGDFVTSNSEFSNFSDVPIVTPEFHFFYSNIPDIDFNTADFNTGARNTTKIGPDNADGFGGSIGGQIPLGGTPISDLFAPGLEPFVDVRGGFDHLSGDGRTTLIQPAGAAPVVGGINGTGTAFALNTFTTFNTEYDSNIGHASIGFGVTGTNVDEQLEWFARLDLNGIFRSTSIDTDYNTSNGAGGGFNNFSNIEADEYIFRPLFGLGGSTFLPGTNNRVRVSLEGKIGPSFHIGDFDYSDCGSTDGTGGACNGGFFRTTASDSSTNVGIFSSVDVKVSGRLGNRIVFGANGGAAISGHYKHNLNTNVATTPGAVVSVGGFGTDFTYEPSFHGGVFVSIGLQQP